MPLDLADDKSTLVQVMAWCRQATSHYLSQCWPRSTLLYGVTKPQWINHTTAVFELCLFWYKTEQPHKRFAFPSRSPSQLSEPVSIFHFPGCIALPLISWSCISVMGSKVRLYITSFVIILLIWMFIEFVVAVIASSTWDVPTLLLRWGWYDFWAACCHKDVMAWKRFPHYWPFVTRIPSQRSHHTGSAIQNLGIFFWC